MELSGMETTQKIQVNIADPSALGLFGLAMVTLVASSQKFGWTNGLAFVLPWAVFLGAFAQLYASVCDALKNNAFGATAFGAYAFFWLAVASSWLIKLGVFGAVLQSAVDESQLGIAFVGYFIFTLFMTIGATETNKTLFLIFLFIDFLFIGLALSSFHIAPELTHKVAACSELLISLLSFYGSAAVMLNTHFGKVFLPLGKPFGIFRKA